ncbi:hypothetical protein LX36DRAFT_716046 [Colletotrichum falcatum]|nr:hypothetical protein LX36DRAFT_716046 [Colletotrichum falcatum]
MEPARDHATAGAKASAAAAYPQSPSSDAQQPQSPSTADTLPRPPSSPRSLSRRQSTNERINEILETARGRAQAMGGGLSTTRSAPTSPPRRYSPAADGSRDESIGIISRGPDRNYQSMNAAPAPSASPDPPAGIRSRKSATQPTQTRLPAQTEIEEDEEDYDDLVAREERERAAQEREPWYTVFLSIFQSIELENKGSVARDHLALERTFLAWLRTSLAFASIGIAVTQLFRLNSSLSGPGDGDGSADPNARTLRHLGKPLGATFLAVSILTLFLGYQRYSRAQRWVMKGKFPASRGTVIVVSLVAFALMAVSLVVVVVVSPTGRDR